MDYGIVKFIGIERICCRFILKENDVIGIFLVEKKWY